MCGSTTVNAVSSKPPQIETYEPSRDRTSDLLLQIAR